MEVNASASMVQSGVSDPGEDAPLSQARPAERAAEGKTWVTLQPTAALSSRRGVRESALLYLLFVYILRREGVGYLCIVVYAFSNRSAVYTASCGATYF